MCMDVHRSYGFVASVRDSSYLNGAHTPGCIPVGHPASPVDSTIPHPTSQELHDPVAADGDTIMAMESRTSEKPIMIFPVFMVLIILVRFFHGSVTRRRVVVYHLNTLSFLWTDKYPKSPGLNLLTRWFYR